MLCAARAQRLTPMRRHVLEALLASHRPLGAYEIIEHLSGHGRLAPITVYRALDFLRDHGLVHRIESRNAFVACVHNHAGDNDLIVFLICERCGAVGEAPGGNVAETLKVSSRAADFAPKKSGDRDCRCLRPLPRAPMACFPPLPRSLSRRISPASLARWN
jgi:Fur family zinc uptake transcriptional regulator